MSIKKITKEILICDYCGNEITDDWWIRTHNADYHENCNASRLVKQTNILQQDLQSINKNG